MNNDREIDEKLGAAWFFRSKPRTKYTKKKISFVTGYAMRVLQHKKCSDYGREL